MTEEQEPEPEPEPEAKAMSAFWLMSWHVE